MKWQLFVFWNSCIALGGLFLIRPMDVGGVVRVLSLFFITLMANMWLGIEYGKTLRKTNPSL